MYMTDNEGMRQREYHEALKSTAYAIGRLDVKGVIGAMNNIAQAINNLADAVRNQPPAEK